MTWIGQVRKSLFGIAPQKTDFATLGFHTSTPSKRNQLQNVCQTFVHGYHAAHLSANWDDLQARLSTVDNAMQGFAYEGAAMAIMLLDIITPWNKNRLQQYLGGIAQSHMYMSYVGAGWAFAQLGFKFDVRRPGIDPLWGWLAMDGIGFHQGFFHHQQYLEDQKLPNQYNGYARRVFDQGLGRVSWFVYGADVEKIASVINAFDLSRRADLWSGVGLACTYAGSVSEAELLTLRTLGAGYEANLAQGAVFAATARVAAHTETPHSDMACRIMCGMSLQETADFADTVIAAAPRQDTHQPAFETLRQMMIQHFIPVGVTV